MRASKANPIKQISGIAYGPVQCSLSKGEATTKASKIRAKGHSARVIKKKDGSYCVYTPETSFVNGTKPKAVKGTKAKVKGVAAKPKAVKGTSQRVGAKKK
jgi:hypothetical protein